MEPHTHTTYWNEYYSRWQAAMKQHHEQLGRLIERNDYGRIQLHASALRLIAENDYEQYKLFCQEAEPPFEPVDSWQIEWRE